MQFFPNPKSSSAVCLQELQAAIAKSKDDAGNADARTEAASDTEAADMARQLARQVSKLLIK